MYLLTSTRPMDMGMFLPVLLLSLLSISQVRFLMHIIILSLSNMLQEGSQVQKTSTIHALLLEVSFASDWWVHHLI